jgi:hypothetical protein
MIFLLNFKFYNFLSSLTALVRFQLPGTSPFSPPFLHRFFIVSATISVAAMIGRHACLTYLSSAKFGLGGS